MQRLFTFIIFTVLLTACGSSTTYYLETNDAEGLETGDKVYRQGVEVGKVTDIDFEDEKVVIEIVTSKPMFEDQGFDVRWEGDKDHKLELDQPRSGANELAEGARLRDHSIGLDLNLDNFSKSLEDALEGAFGKDGEKLESLLESFSGWSEGSLADLEKWGEEMEVWAKEHEDEFEEMGRKMEKWGADKEVKMEKLGEELERISEEYELGSDKWRRELKRALERLE